MNFLFQDTSVVHISAVVSVSTMPPVKSHLKVDLDDFIDGGVTVEGGLTMIDVRLGFGLFIGIFLLFVMWTIYRTCCDVMDAEDDATIHGSRNQSDVNRSRIRNGYPEIRRSEELESNV